jgi:hypothetical protein
MIDLEESEQDSIENNEQNPNVIKCEVIFI